MTLTQEEQKMIRNSWGKIITHSQETGEAFYRHFFALRPDLEVLFPTDLKLQTHKLLAAVTILVTKMDKAEHIREEVQKLAHRHTKYGVEPAYFAVFGEAFVLALAEILASIWNEPLKKAWQSAFQMIAEAMIAEMS
ncbi:MAG: globin domain-containing protein [Microscillaceae bacterium]|jgi:nitric oxide dioxygenase|nr:globin domain-containing protein [Microscillaceae bacterium]